MPLNMSIAKHAQMRILLNIQSLGRLLMPCESGTLHQRLAALWLALSLWGCTGEPDALRTYDQAASWYLNNAVTDEMRPGGTAIDHAAYCGSSRRLVLLIAFKTNPEKHYIYEGVPVSLWYEFTRSQSKGSFYNQHIRGRFKFHLENSRGD